MAKILVVDDEKLIVKGIRLSLEQDGMEVDCAYDGEEAINLAKEKEYEEQATRYRVLYWVMNNQNQQPGTNITGITFWGPVDHYSWLQSHSNVGGGNTGNLNQCPLLFDENYEPKPAFYVFAGEQK